VAALAAALALRVAQGEVDAALRGFEPACSKARSRVLASRWSRFRVSTRSTTSCALTRRPSIAIRTSTPPSSWGRGGSRNG
jgi:hypothetical protein